MPMVRRGRRLNSSPCVCRVLWLEHPTLPSSHWNLSQWIPFYWTSLNRKQPHWCQANLRYVRQSLGKPKVFFPWAVTSPKWEELCPFSENKLFSWQSALNVALGAPALWGCSVLKEDHNLGCALVNQPCQNSFGVQKHLSMLPLQCCWKDANLQWHLKNWRSRKRLQMAEDLLIELLMCQVNPLAGGFTSGTRKAVLVKGEIPEARRYAALQHCSSLRSGAHISPFLLLLCSPAGVQGWAVGWRQRAQARASPSARGKCGVTEGY